MRSRSSVVGLALLLAAAPGLLAQPVAGGEPLNPDTLSAIAFFKVAPAQSDAFVEWIQSTYGPSLKRLQETGKLINWGVGSPVFHEDMSWTHAAYFTAVDWAGLEAAYDALEARDRSLGPDEQKSMLELWSQGVDLDAHHDEVVRHVRLGGSEAGAHPRYLVIDTHTARPGQTDAVLDFYDRRIEPIYRQLVADGTVIEYGVYVPELHMGQSYTHAGWYFVDSLARIDAVDRAFDAAIADWPAGEWDRLDEIFDQAPHRDIVLRVYDHD